MKNRLKNGFTLVELLVTIVLLGVVGAIVIYNMTSVTSESKESDYERFIATVKSAAQVYADNNPDVFNQLYSNKAFVYFTIGDLVENGLIDESLINPYTEERVGHDEKIKANLDSAEGGLFFEYPLGENPTETFLVAVSDYVHNGEPYDCMQGKGTYQLALSDEEGNLIDLTDESIKEYKVECSMPEDVFTYRTDLVNKHGEPLPAGYVSTTAGSYDITYTWLTKSGTRKSAKRTLRVLPKVIPTFDVKVGTDTNQRPYNYDLSATTPEVFEPIYNKSNNSWERLWIVASIEGGDSLNTKYTIKRKSLSANKEESLATNDSSFKAIEVADGLNEYTISVEIYGHYVENYWYDAEGVYAIHQELVLPKELISGEDKAWTFEKTYKISRPYSKVGVAKYEYAIVAPSGTAPKKADNIENAHVFNSQGGVTTKTVSIISDACRAQKLEYDKIYFRAINSEGYVGAWTPTALTANLTNHLAKIVSTESDSCSNCNSCCVKDSSSCYYCDAIRYVSFGGKKFTLLEKDGKNNVLAAFDGLSANKVTPTAYVNDTWSIVTCDGTFSKNYQYSSPVVENIINEGNRFLDSLPENYDKFLNYKKWPSGYSAYVGTVTSDYFKRYSNALLAPNPYWTTDTYQTSFKITVDTPYNHGNSTTKYDTFFYAVENGQLTQIYAGGEAYVKPLIEFNESTYLCGGSGTKANPYVIATK